MVSMFITLEGPEGAGKSTLAVSLKAALEVLGHTVTLSREPGAGVVGKAIRDILLHGEDLDPKCELFLFLADRSHHVANTVRPALARGEIVICDRYVDSTVVYQGHARGMDVEELRRLNAWATGGLMPKVTLLLDLDPEIGLARRSDLNRLDAESLDFHKKVRQGFLYEAARADGRLISIDATRPPEEILALSVQIVSGLLSSS